MKESIMKVLEALRKIDAGRASELEREFQELAPEKHSEFLMRVTEATSAGISRVINIDPAVAKAAAEMLRDAASTARDGQRSDVLARTEEALAETKKMQFAFTLDRKLTESKLPVPAAMLVR